MTDEKSPSSTLSKTNKSPGAPGGGGKGASASPGSGTEGSRPCLGGGAVDDETHLGEALGAALGDQLGPALRSMSSTLETIRRQGEDDRTLGEGTLGFLRGSVRWRVFLVDAQVKLENDVNFAHAVLHLSL